MDAAFYTSSKALGWVTDPAACALLLVLLAVLLASRRPGLAATAAAVAATELVIFSAPAVAARLDAWICASAPRTYRPDARYDAAIVLGGGDDRVAGGLAVVLAGAGRHFVYSGALSRSEAQAIVDRLRVSGIDGSRVLIEARSRNTYENAVESSRLVAEYGWRSLVLVTSASHVQRALGCFHRLGLDPDVLPVVDDVPPREPGWFPRPAAVALSKAVLHEIAGRVVYRLVGYSD